MCVCLSSHYSQACLPTIAMSVGTVKPGLQALQSQLCGLGTRRDQASWLARACRGHWHYAGWGSVSGPEVRQPGLAYVEPRGL